MKQKKNNEQSASNPVDNHIHGQVDLHDHEQGMDYLTCDNINEADICINKGRQLCNCGASNCYRNNERNSHETVKYDSEWCGHEKGNHGNISDFCQNPAHYKACGCVSDIDTLGNIDSNGIASTVGNYNTMREHICQNKVSLGSQGMPNVENGNVCINGNTCLPVEYNGGSVVKWRKQRQAKEQDSNSSTRNSMHWEEFFGSSLDLSPSLLGIYDEIASANQDKDQGSNNQLDITELLANENVRQESVDEYDSSKQPNSNLNSESNNQLDAGLCESHDALKPIIKVDWDETDNCRLKMESLDNFESIDGLIDNKKRPLSISSMSSSSTSSLPRRRKRPNLSEYSDSSSGQLDIEKMDNILYIDDTPDQRRSTDDEISVSSEGKRKSGGDTDSQYSADQSSLGGNSAGLNTPRHSFHQSDSSISFTPSNPTKVGNNDLSVGLDKTPSSSQHDNKPTRSPSRTSQKSTGIARSQGSVKQGGHYVSYVQRVVSEIVDTERIYVDNLHDIKVGYYQHITDSLSLKIPPEEVACLFGNIIEIYDFSCLFLKQLEDCGMEPIAMAECFVRNSDGFVIYAEYCTNYPSAVAVLTRVMQDARLSEVFKQRQLAIGHSLPLGAYLLKPVQRVLKYHLLLQNILKHHGKSDAGYASLVMALEHMTGMAHHINEMKRKHEHAVRVQEIQSQLEDYDGEDFTRLGELVLEGSFRMYGVKASRQMFLFQRGVIIAKRKEDGMLSCKAFIPCATLMLVESIPREPLNFQILPFDNPRGAHTIHARNMDQKRSWCQQIKRLILESYTSKIPDSVKDLIIEKLGKSKEEEDFVHVGTRDTEPGKSHVTTPDYLERRQKLRRKSAANLIPDILKRKVQVGRGRGETASPKPSPSADHAGRDGSPQNVYSGHVDRHGFRSRTPDGIKSSTLPWKSSSRIQKMDYPEGSNRSPGTKRPLSIQRSHSFQLATSKKPLKSEDIVAEPAATEYLSHSDGPALRTHSFRLATKLSPIKLDADDDITVNKATSPNKLASPKHRDLIDGVLTVHNDTENIPSSVQENIDKELDKLHGECQSPNINVLRSSNRDNIITNHSEDMSFRKRGRYSSMPVLNGDSLSSPKVSRLSSEREAQSPTINHNSIPKSSLHRAKQIDIKPYFTWNKDKVNLLPSPDGKGPNDSITNLSRESRAVHAFQAVSCRLHKSSDNLDINMLPPRPLSLTQPKPFVSTLITSASLMGSQARLNRWKTGERFTKGSMSDLSLLYENPWIRNKQRSRTDSDVTPSRDINEKERLQRERNHSFAGDERMFSKDNLDWIVYANRNSLPIAGFPTEEINRQYKYCTPPRGSMEPPGRANNPAGKLLPHENTVDMHCTPTRFNVNCSSTPTQYGMDYSVNADSSVSLSATATSSDTCSSPDILKDAVFEDGISSDKIMPRDRAHLSRSFSSPERKHSLKLRRHLQDERPASADVMADLHHLKESDRLLVEMENYMKQSSSSSGSLSSVGNKFPKSIPTFTPKNEGRKTSNRDSCVSSGSTSSYESAVQDLDETSHNEDSFVDSLKNKIHNITSKLTGRKSSESDSENINDRTRFKSPAKIKQDDTTVKTSPLSHTLSLKAKHGQQKITVPDLPTLLRESEQGSEIIGSRMANNDWDDYATFLLPLPSATGPGISNPAVYSSGVQLGITSPYKTLNQHFDESPSRYSPVSSLKNLNIQQSDSAFSIQSVDIDSTPDDSPRNAEENNSKSPATGPHFYERRLSDVLNNDEAFRDSAVYCDDIDSPVTPPTPSKNTPVCPTKVPIKAYVQHLEDKNKVSSPPTFKVLQREPSAIIRQRMESLSASSEYRKSGSASRTTSATTSRTQSRDVSRAASEERQIHPYTSALKEYMDSKYPMENTRECDTRDEVLTTRDEYHFGSGRHIPSNGKLKAAYSLGRLDQLTSDVDNLTIMKGWVRQLISKFQAEK